MIYKLLNEQYGIKTYARIDDDGICRLTCTEEYPELKKWLSEGNEPLPADEGAK